MRCAAVPTGRGERYLPRWRGEGEIDGSRGADVNGETYAFGHLATEPSNRFSAIWSCHVELSESRSTIRMGDVATSRMQARFVPGHERTPPRLQPGLVNSNRPPANRLAGGQNTGAWPGRQSDASRSDLDVLGFDGPACKSRSACRHRRHNRPTLGGGKSLSLVDDSKKFQVLITKRHDEVRRASAGMMSTRQDDEAEGLHVVLSADKVADEDEHLNESVTHNRILTAASATG